MAERIQKTAQSMREKMLNRYGDEYHHKHDKNHLSYRFHSRSHPCDPRKRHDYDVYNAPSKHLNRELNSQKLLKRLDKGRIH